MTAPELKGETAFIDLQHIVKVFHTQAGEVTVLKGIDLVFNAGEFTAVVGKSGSGKSTLVNMITGIDHPTNGSVVIGGTSLHTLGEGQLAVWRGRMLGVVFQFFQLLPMLTVRENILLPMDLAGLIPWEQREERVRKLLDLVGCADLADKLPGALSGGQQQTAAIARALANDPPIIVADEPTGNLDSVTAETIFNIFQGLAAAGKTILMVTHDMGLANRIRRRVILCDGEVIDTHLASAFLELPHPQLLELTHASSFKQLAASQALAEGDLSGYGLVVIAEGQVRVEINAEPKNRAKNLLLQAGEVLPMDVLHDGARWKLSAPEETGDGTLLILIPEAALEKGRAAQPAVWQAILDKARLSHPQSFPTGQPGRSA